MKTGFVLYVGHLQCLWILLYSHEHYAVCLLENILRTNIASIKDITDRGKGQINYIMSKYVLLY